MTTRTSIPTTVEDIDLAWFQSVLKDKVVAARRIGVIHGTATKVNVELTFAEADGSTRVQRVWVKTGLEPHSKSIGQEKVYAGETFFYRNYGGTFETRTPQCLFADSDDTGASAIVLDDLGQHGARFMDPTKAGSPEVIAAGLEYIARYQAASWMNADLHAVDWLRNGGAFDAADCLAWLYDPDHWRDYESHPRYQALAPQFRDRELMLKAHQVVRRDWLRRGPWALSQGDSHFGQLYALPNGEARLLDWQCVQVANYMFDPACLMVSGLSPADRRACERDLITHYLGKLKEFGVEAPPSAEDAYQALRAFTLHELGGWAMCLTEMQPEEICTAFTERTSPAGVELRTLERLLG